MKLLIADATGLPGAAYLFDTTGKSNSDMGWTTFAYDFVAMGSSTTLTFSNPNQNGFRTPYGAALDNVSIALAPIVSDGAVPEPSTWALMLVGFAGLGLALHQRRAAALA